MKMISLLVGLPHCAVVHIIGHKCVCVCPLYIQYTSIYIYILQIYIYIQTQIHTIYIYQLRLLMAHFYYCQPPQAAVAQPSIRARCTISPEPWRSRSTDAWEWINAWLQFFGMEVIYIHDYIYIYMYMYHHISKNISYHIGCCMVGCNLNHLGMVSTI